MYIINNYYNLLYKYININYNNTNNNKWKILKPIVLMLTNLINIAKHLQLLIIY